MKIKALKPICGPSIHIMAGHIADIDDETAKSLIAADAAVEIPVEKAAEAEGEAPESQPEPETKKKGKKKAAEAEGDDKK